MRDASHGLGRVRSQQLWQAGVCAIVFPLVMPLVMMATEAPATTPQREWVRSHTVYKDSDCTRVAEEVVMMTFDGAQPVVTKRLLWDAIADRRYVVHNERSGALWLRTSVEVVQGKLPVRTPVVSYAIDEHGEGTVALCGTTVSFKDDVLPEEQPRRVRDRMRRALTACPAETREALEGFVEIGNLYRELASAEAETLAAWMFPDLASESGEMKRLSTLAVEKPGKVYIGERQLPAFERRFEAGSTP